MRNTNRSSISTIAWRTSPACSWRAAPRVRLDMPETMAASWSPLVRSSSADIAMSRPSAETHRVYCAPGTVRTKLSSSHA